MTYEEALSELDGATSWDFSLDVLSLARAAIEKRIPKKLTYGHYCSTCGTDVNGIKGGGDYCFRCGQKIGWGDDNGET